MDEPRIRGLSEWRPIARGLRTVVWEARQLSLDRLIAVKVYQSELDDAGRRRYLREAAAAGRLSARPGIVATYDAGILTDGRPYLMMELCPGGSLSQWLHPEHRRGEEQVRQVGAQLADALAAVHACGVLHRDVKPNNMLIDNYGHPKLADFALSTVLGAEAVPTEPLWLTSGYAPPEAFRGQSATESGDVYSLAATIYALLAGAPPRYVSHRPVAAEVTGSRIAPLPGVDRLLMHVLLSALGDQPDQRPTAAQFRDQLANVRARNDRASGLAAGHAEPVSPTSAPRQSRSRVAVFALAAVTVAAALPVTAYLVREPTTVAGPAATTQSSPVSSVPMGGASSAAPDPQPSGSTSTPETDDRARSGSQAIQLRDPDEPAQAYQTIRIQGEYPGGAETFVRVQRWEDGKWTLFPIPAKTDQSGQFTAYVELGEPGRYRLRVMDPDSGAKSKSFVLVIRD